MPLSMASSPRPDEPTSASDAAPSWAADVTEAGPAPRPVVDASTQLPLFHSNALEPAPPGTRAARLPGRLKALLGGSRTPPAPNPAPDTRGLPSSTWPDSFFDSGPES